jgi:hypothetical protein
LFGVFTFVTAVLPVWPIGTLPVEASCVEPSRSDPMPSSVPPAGIRELDVHAFVLRDRHRPVVAVAAEQRNVVGAARVDDDLSGLERARGAASVAARRVRVVALLAAGDQPVAAAGLVDADLERSEAVDVRGIDLHRVRDVRRHRERSDGALGEQRRVRRLAAGSFVVPL